MLFFCIFMVLGYLKLTITQNSIENTKTGQFQMKQLTKNWLRRNFFSKFIFPGLIGAGSCFSQQIVINEIQASNTKTIFDEDGESSDWIELFNPGPGAVNLGGYGLSDNPEKPLKWTLPSINLAAGQYLLVFASGKDRNNELNWQTIITRGDRWRYLVPTVEPSSAWRTGDFNDSDWQQGASGFGYSDDDDATVLEQIQSVFLRKTFELDASVNVEQIVFHMDYDDGFVAYLNDVEIARANLGQPGIRVPFNQYTDSDREAQIYQGGMPVKFVVDNPAGILRTGKNVLAVQVHNISATSSDLTAIPFLTLGFTSEPTGYNRGIAPILASEFGGSLHSNFKIKADNETIRLSNPDGDSLDGISVKDLPADVSLGRQPDGSADWFLFYEPTPGESNRTEALQNFAEPPVFSVDGGYVNNSFSLEFEHESPQATVYYTLDCSEPDESSPVYSSPIMINKTTVVRARAVSPGHIPGKIITQTYLYQEDFTLPVISLVTEPDNLWDYNTGIYEMGPNASSDNPYYGANFWQDWEKPIHVEMFENDGMLAFSLDGGIKIFGGWSRAHAQKSFSIFARNEYGTKDIDYQIFPDKMIKQFKSFILRNSGNDWSYTLFRDALMQSLVKECDLETMAYCPAIIFLNGEYWGIQNIREKLNEDFIASNCEVDADNVDLLEFDGGVVEGDASHYQNMMNYINSHNMALSATYDSVKTMLDVHNYMLYQIAQIYYDNTDWPGNNIKFWRPRLPGGKWRWLMYDTDFGFNLFGSGNYHNNTLAFALEPNGPDWPNPPWSTLLFRKLVQNAQFRKDFINLYADMLNTVFDADHVSVIIDQFRDRIMPEIPRHNQKWTGVLSNWLGEVELLYTFANERPENARSHIRSQFGLGGVRTFNIAVQPSNSGKIKINTRIYSNLPAKATYFQGNPIQVMAIPEKGYRFKEWNDNRWPGDPVVEIDPKSYTSVAAIFEEINWQEFGVVINEINYNSASTRNAGDWIEIFNHSDDPVDLSGWRFSDSDDSHFFEIPPNTVIAGGEFIVLCRDKVTFGSVFPKIENVIGNFPFGLNGGGELIRLFDATGALVDSVRFDDADPWPTGANGAGATLELKSALKDNALVENWQASYTLGGTPGKPNSNLTDIAKSTAKIKSFRLLQNYPNPFNSQTVIRYQLPEAALVVLRLYNIQGQLISILKKEHEPAGSHQFNWSEFSETKNSMILASGVYFYRIDAVGEKKNYSFTRKLLYLK